MHWFNINNEMDFQDTNFTLQTLVFYILNYFNDHMILPIIYIV